LSNRLKVLKDLERAQFEILQRAFARFTKDLENVLAALFIELYDKLEEADNVTDET